MEFIPFHTILEEITQDEKTRFMTIKEVAYVMNRDPQTVYSYLHGDTQPNWDSAVLLANHIRTEYGYHKMSMQTMLSACGGRANGQVLDDLMGIYSAGTDLHRAYNAGDKTAYDNAISKMKAELLDLQAEGAKL